MRIEAFFVGAALAFCGAAPASAQAPAATPELFGALPTASEVAISPDGQTIAVLQSFGEDSAILFYPVDEPGAQPTGARLTKSRARSISWASNEHLLLLASELQAVDTIEGRQRLEFWRWVSVSKEDSAPEVLFRNEGDMSISYFVTGAGDVLAAPPEKANEVIFSRLGYVGDPSTYRATNIDEGAEIVLNVLAANISNGRFRRVAMGQDDTEQWIVDAAGEPLIRVDYDQAARTSRVFRRTGSGFSELFSFGETGGEGAIVGVHGLTPTGQGLFATRNDANGKRSLVEVDMTGAVVNTFFSNSEFDIASVSYNWAKAAPDGVSYVDDLPRSFFLDPAKQRLQDSLARAIPGAAPQIVSQSSDGARVIVRAVYPNHPDQFFIYSRAERQLDMFAPTYGGLDGHVMAQKEKYDYVSSDGLTIPGYLTVPEGATKSSMPLIVLAHDGPNERSDMAFDYWSFFYAARGYLVYQPNFRGSAGYGASFRAAGDGQWGRKIQDDVTGGVQRLIADGLVDPGRVCVVGRGFGGYVALVGATLTPGLYDCAVSVNGISDPVSLAVNRVRSSRLAENYHASRLGDLSDAEAAANAASPLDEASSASASILLIHGRDDMIVPHGQSFAMAEALERAGRPYEFITLAGEDHWLSSSEGRSEMLAKSIEFIDRHIGGGD